MLYSCDIGLSSNSLDNQFLEVPFLAGEHHLSSTDFALGGLRSFESLYDELTLRSGTVVLS